MACYYQIATSCSIFTCYIDSSRSGILAWSWRSKFIKYVNFLEHLSALLAASLHSALCASQCVSCHCCPHYRALLEPYAIAAGISAARLGLQVRSPLSRSIVSSRTVGRTQYIYCVDLFANACGGNREGSGAIPHRLIDVSTFLVA